MGADIATPNPDALLSIGAAVEQLRVRYPEVSHSSLRFLEREGLLHSVRTTGGHRLYSEDELVRVALIKSWQREGNTLDQIRQRLDLRDSLIDPAKLSADFLQLAESNRLDDARRLILDAERAGLPPRTLFYEVLQPALIAVGDQWATGALPVHEEKAISEVCRELVTEITLRNAPDYPTGPFMIAACVEGERHEIGLCMVYGLLRQRGYRVRYLGVDVATPFLLDAIRANRPVGILLSSSVESSHKGCIDALVEIQELPAEQRPSVVLVGGEIARHLSAELERLSAIPVSNASAMDHLEERLDLARHAN